MSQPFVAEAAVVGAKDETTGQRDGYHKWQNCRWSKRLVRLFLSHEGELVTCINRMTIFRYHPVSNRVFAEG